MAKEIKHIDVSRWPELLGIIEEVHSTRKPRLLKRDDEVLAILMPVKPPSKQSTKRPKTKADYEAFLSSAGSWKGIVDTDKLITDIYESRRASSRPPVEL